ncbi:hypothetical protein [Nocardioides sp. MH1]|uniref:hypothetical protein n=1 Tax=Nocardioides sp. MH1 TaxID=3242490 RepID=UPI003520642A
MIPDQDFFQELSAALAPVGPHTLLGAVSMAAESDSSSADLLVQREGSGLPLALWFGPDLPDSPDAEGFAPEAFVAEASDGSIVAFLEEQREDADGEVYEIVRIVVGYRPDGLVVTVNRYADPNMQPAEASWSFEALRAVVLDPRVPRPPA